MFSLRGRLEYPPVHDGDVRKRARRLALVRRWANLAERRVPAPLVVEVDNPTPILPSHEKSVTRGTHGSVVLSRCTRCSSSMGRPCAGAVSRKSARVEP
jgi:hypothetical protein